MFTGGYGVGKTHLAAAIANYQAERGYPAMFVVVPDLLDHLRAAFSPDARTSFDQRFEEVRTASLLVLDDLGTESATPWAREKLYQIINHRYVAHLPTVITTSVSPDDLDPRIRTRILDETHCMVFPLLVPSYRGGPPPKEPKESKSGRTYSPRKRSAGQVKLPGFFVRLVVLDWLSASGLSATCTSFGPASQTTANGLVFLRRVLSRIIGALPVECAPCPSSTSAPVGSSGFGPHPNLLCPSKFCWLGRFGRPNRP